MEVVYDIEAPALVIDEDGNVVSPGSRILSLIIDGEVIIEDGMVVPGGTFDIATADFVANGGDQIFNANFLSQQYAFTRIVDADEGRLLTDQAALEAYLVELSGGDTNFDLASDSRYNNFADGRIVAIPEPTTAGLIALGGLGVLARRRQQG